MQSATSTTTTGISASLVLDDTKREAGYAESAQAAWTSLQALVVFSVTRIKPFSHFSRQPLPSGPMPLLPLKALEIELSWQLQCSASCFGVNGP